VAFVASRFSLDWAVLAALAVVFGLAQNTFALANNLEIAARHRARAAIFQAADPVLRLILAAAALAVLAPSAPAAMFAVAAGITLACVLQWWTFSRGLASDPFAVPGRPSPDAVSAATAEVLHFARYFMLAGAFAWLQLSSDRWAVKVYLNDAAVGLFAVAYQMASVPGVILAGCLSQFVSPIVFQRAKAGDSRSALDHARRAIFAGVAALIVLTAASTVVAYFLGEPLLVLFTSDAYRSAGVYVAPLVLGLGLLQIGHMLTLLPMSSNRLGGVLIVKIAHGTLAAVLNALAVRAYGLPGLCAASVAGGAVYVVLVLANNHRIMRTLAPDVVPALPKPLLQP
jgi:O-antigen/teichoic acid export membrane protein